MGRTKKKDMTMFSKILSAFLPLLSFAALSACATTQANVASTSKLQFAAALSGSQYPTSTGSLATGTAEFEIDRSMQQIDVRITVKGLNLAQLSKQLSSAPIGPMHLHRYQGDNVSLIMPFPMSAVYADTPDGFTVTMRRSAFAKSAEILNSGISFDQFLAALRDDPVYLNIHTERFGEGEISGRLVTVKAPS